jgi:hypothetical protein
MISFGNAPLGPAYVSMIFNYFSGKSMRMCTCISGSGQNGRKIEQVG